MKNWLFLSQATAVTPVETDVKISLVKVLENRLCRVKSYREILLCLKAQLDHEKNTFKFFFKY